jgi:hypothetical protein
VDSLSTTPNDTEPVAGPTTATPTSTIFRLTMAVLWTVVILVLCWTPGELVESLERRSPWFAIPNLDKLVHWGIFVVFTVLWLRVGSSRWQYAWVGLGGLALAAMSEILQNLPWIGRDGNLDDTMTDLIGILIGLAVARWIEPLLSYLESRKFRNSIS